MPIAVGSISAITAGATRRRRTDSARSRWPSSRDLRTAITSRRTAPTAATTTPTPANHSTPRKTPATTIELPAANAVISTASRRPHVPSVVDPRIPHTVSCGRTQSLQRFVSRQERPRRTSETRPTSGRTRRSSRHRPRRKVTPLAPVRTQAIEHIANLPHACAPRTETRRRASPLCQCRVRRS